MGSQRERWNRIFRRLDGGEAGHDLWLERWMELLGDSEGSILDLGCGAGHDTRFLVERGFPVVAVDFSEEALRIAHRVAPEASVTHLDMTHGLPFPDECFRAVVASLSLHYFPWDEMVGISTEIRRCLHPGGHVLARLNSTNDEFHKNAEKTEIERNFYLVGETPKRLFDHESIGALFERGWNVIAAEERTMGRFGSEKTLWEVVVEKSEKLTG